MLGFSPSYQLCQDLKVSQTGHQMQMMLLLCRRGVSYDADKGFCLAAFCCSTECLGRTMLMAECATQAWG